jgi:hypothetical protein
MGCLLMKGALNNMKEDIVYKGIELTVYFDYTPFVPGKLDGPWGDCYPDDPEQVGIRQILHAGDEITDIISTDAWNAIYDLVAIRMNDKGAPDETELD